MSTRKVKAGEAYVELIARDRTAGALRRAEQRLEAFAQRANMLGQAMAVVGTGLLAAGSAIAGGLAAAAKVFADTGDEINKMADRTGVAHEELSRWVHAANQSGASAKLLETALRNMAKNGADPRRFREFASEINAIEDPALKVAKAMELWGKAGAMMLPVIRDLDALSAEADALGLIITPEAAARATALGDAWGRLLRVGKDLAFEIGDAIAEPLTRMIQGMTQGVAAVAAFVQQNQAMVTGIGALAVVAIAAGGALIVMGAVLVAASTAAASLVAAYAALITPFGLTAAAVAVIAGALLMAAGSWLVFSDTGRAALASTLGVVAGIANAIAAGNILNAWEQLGTAMQIVWQHTVNFIRTAFLSVMREVTEVLAQTMERLANSFKLIPGYGKIVAKGLSKAAAGSRNLADKSVSAGERAGEQEIVRLQAQLDALRAQVAGPAAAVATRAAEVFAASVDVSAGLGAGGGGAAGTFNAAAAGLLGRAAPALEQETKKQTGLLQSINDVLGDIDSGIESLEGFAME